jgi:hypothetical protein
VYRIKTKEVSRKKPVLVSPNPPPRYDEVFQKGTEMLNRDAAGLPPVDESASGPITVGGVPLDNHRYFREMAAHGVNLIQGFLKVYNKNEAWTNEQRAAILKLEKHVVEYRVNEDTLKREGP